jgi:hypothetical protein
MRRGIYRLTVLRPVALFSAMLLANHPTAAQNGQASREERPKPPDPNTPRELIYPYYNIQAGYESTLDMMNRSARVVEFTVSVHSQSGEGVTSKPMTISPTEEVVIEIKKLLNDMNIDYRGDFSEGNLSINFRGEGNPLAGRMLVKGPHEALNLGPVWNMGESGQNMVPLQLDGLWWDLGGSRDVEAAVINITDKPEVADLFLDFGGKRRAAEPLSLAPHGTRPISITRTLAEMKLTPFEAPTGGFTIVPRSGKPTLVAEGEITDAESGLVTALNFSLPQVRLASALHATGVPIGPPSADSPFRGFKGANFTPHIYVRNLLDSEQTLDLTVEYPGEKAPQSTALPALRIPGYTTLDVRLDAYYGYLPLPLPFCAVRVQHNGPPGSLIAEMTAVNETTNQARQIRIENEGNGYAGSLVSYWSLEGKKDFLAFLTNMGERDCRVAFAIQAGSVKYLPHPIKLAPHETRVIGFRELRDKQIADADGHVLPHDAVVGRMTYIRLDLVPMLGAVQEVPWAQ